MRVSCDRGRAPGAQQRGLGFALPAQQRHRQGKGGSGDDKQDEDAHGELGSGHHDGALQASLANLTSAPGLHNATVTTGLPTLLGGLDRAVVVARSQLAVGTSVIAVSYTHLTLPTI